MTDVLYLLLTLVPFALLALLVGAIDRRLDTTAPAAAPQPGSTTEPAAGRTTGATP